MRFLAITVAFALAAAAYHAGVVLMALFFFTWGAWLLVGLVNGEKW